MDKETVRKTVTNMTALGSLNLALRERIATIFLEISAPQRVAANTTLFRAGDVSNNVGLVLLEGELTIQKDGNLEVTAQAPDLIGEMAQLNPLRQRTATVVAATELKILRFTWPEFNKAALSKLSESELKSVTEALHQHAWRHFTE
jgi:CRP-like cAMP-binding protein